MERSVRRLVLALAGLVGFPLSCGAAEAVEPFLRDLPPGLFLRQSDVIPAAQTAAIGGKLGGKIERLTNSVLVVHGRPIKVNAITAPDATNARAIYRGLAKFKAPPFILQRDRVVIEYVGNQLAPALAVKTSYELGFHARPERIRYRVRAELATIDRADYMACNPLFQQLLAAHGEAADAAIPRIAQLSARFTFGKSLSLRNPQFGANPASYEFQPVHSAVERSPATARYTFAEPLERHGVAFVRATLEVTTDQAALLAEPRAPGAALTAATASWPAEDAEVVALAERITAGRQTSHAKAMAILQWLAPGKNINYAGQTGSRWGTKKVLAQKSGHCWDFSDCFVSLCRAAGVPARQVAGWLYGSSGHVWAEFYHAGRGWQQVDPSGGGTLRCGIYHIPYFTTDDGEMPIVYLSMPEIEIIDAG